MENNEIVDIAKEVYVGRLFTLGGSVLFFIGSVLAADAGYREFVRLSRDSQNSDVIK